MGTARDVAGNILKSGAGMSLPSPESVAVIERGLVGITGLGGIVLGFAVSAHETGLDNLLEAGQAVATGTAAGVAGTLLVGASIKFTHFLERLE